MQVDRAVLVAGQLHLEQLEQVILPLPIPLKEIMVVREVHLHLIMVVELGVGHQQPEAEAQEPLVGQEEQEQHPLFLAHL
jgi:hypothetical protein